MSEERDFMGLGSELMRGAPLLPANSLEEERQEVTAPSGPDAKGQPDGDGPSAGSRENNLAGQGKAIIRQAIVSGRAEAALSTVATAAEKTREGVDVLLQILSLAKTRLEGTAPSGEGMPNPLLASQAEMVWKLIKVPEFQHLAASMLARLLAN
ncbi:MAG: hypothetical protein PWQ41_1861 [Bacillota bacterium]|nr:hypothetical protein [Bacillota bacterium]MDK2856795.1 hypothetical protein [Bacillota bacterium]MDK2926087.1 hypothetical protein [Bacillota bacterium]